MLIAAPAAWDEVCFAIPAVKAMAASGLKVGVLCEDRQRPVWETLAGVSVIGFPEKTSAKRIAPGIAGHWEAAILWEPGIAAEACLRAKIERRIGPESEDLKKLLTHPVERPKVDGPVQHRVRHYLSLVEKLGVATGEPAFFAPLSAGSEPAQGAVLLAPDSDFGKTYEWPLDRWVALGKALLDGGHRVAVAVLKGERDLGVLLAAALGNQVRLIEAEPLAGILPQLAIHPLVIAAEGSLPHLAAYAGSTCVTLFGPGDPMWKRPLGRRHAVARRHVECAPCFLTKCPMDLRCQNELALERVLAVLREKLPQPV